MSTKEIQRRMDIVNSITDPTIKSRLKDAVPTNSFTILCKHLLK